MSQWIYEQDLISQKYRILIAMRHDRIIRQISAELGICLQDLRKYIIEHCDMILLENLPARYEAALVAAGACGVGSCPVYDLVADPTLARLVLACADRLAF